MKAFNSKHVSNRIKIANKYYLPKDTSNIMIDDNGQPFQQLPNGRIYYSLKPQSTFDNFHGYSRKQLHL